MPPKEDASKKPAKAQGKEGGKKGKEEKKKEAAPAPKPPTPLEVLNRNLVLLDKYVDSRDRLFLVRVMRYTGFVRQHIAMDELRKAVDAYVVDPARREALQLSLTEVASVRAEQPAPAAAPPAADVQMPDAGSSAPAAAAASNGSGAAAAASSDAAPKLPKAGGPSALELDVYLHLLAVTMLHASGKVESAGDAAGRLIEYLADVNRRTLDFFQARAWHYLALAHEAAGTLAALRPLLVAAHRTACLRHDEFGQAVLLNLLLRAYIAAREFEAAQGLIAKTTFPEAVSNNQFVRYLFATGRVHAVQLAYSDAYSALVQAGRKAPQSAVGFRAQVAKFSVCVQLLMGDIPERSVFSQPDTARALAPYLALARAVRSGELPAFAAAVAAHQAAFERDATLSLVRRLEANVIKTGLRRIASSYSRISFAEIAAKLSLGGPEDAEFLAAKAVRDGVIDAVLDHEAGALVSRAVANVYSTKEPQEAFHRRITFCLDVHNEAVKSMRYPARAGADGLESDDARREREAEEAAFLNDIAEGKGFDEDDDEEM